MALATRHQPGSRQSAVKGSAVSGLSEAFLWAGERDVQWVWALLLLRGKMGGMLVRWRYYSPLLHKRAHALMYAHTQIHSLTLALTQITCFRYLACSLALAGTFSARHPPPLLKTRLHDSTLSFSVLCYLQGKRHIPTSAEPRPEALQVSACQIASPVYLTVPVLLSHDLFI